MDFNIIIWDNIRDTYENRAGKILLIFFFFFKHGSKVVFIWSAVSSVLVGCLVLAAFTGFIAAPQRARDRGGGGFKSTARALIATLIEQLRMFSVEPADSV